MFRQAALRAGRSLHGFSYWSPATSVGLRGFLGTGQAMMPPLHVEEETYCRQRSLIVLEDKLPTASPDSWVAPNAVVVGDVDLGDGVGLPCLLNPNTGVRCLKLLSISVVNAFLSTPSSLTNPFIPLSQVSVWYGGVLRGDLAPVRIGCFSSIGERTTVTTARCLLASYWCYR